MSDTREGVVMGFEGIEGSGKTTCINYVAERLRACGERVELLRGIGAGAIGMALREVFLAGSTPLLPKAHATALALGHVECLEKAEALAKDGCHVLIDRSLASYYAYQVKAFALPVAEDLYNELMCGVFAVKAPTTSVFCRLPPAVALQRLQSRLNQNDWIDNQALEFHERVWYGYEDWMRYDGSGDDIILDCERPFDKVAKDLDKIIASRFRITA